MMKKSSPIMLRFTLFKIAFYLAHITPLRIAYGLARCLTETHHFFSREDKRCITENLEVILDDRTQLTRIRKQVFLNFGRYLVEFLRTDTHFNLSFIKNNVKIEGAAYLEQLKEDGRGGIFVTAHIGNWEMGGLALSLLGFPMTAIA
ncbi:MAG: hypothetical protein KC713_04540, partial [Candidatus Omnitrophica bacterium]|nr:hypothetical protein [Candidatus Omnitrophota bacterium]